MRLFALAYVAGVVSMTLAACGASTDPAATDVTSETVSPAATVEPADSAEPAARVEPAETVEPPAGRLALAAAEGSPHVLWFWGAH